MENIIGRIDKLLQRSDLNSFEKDFLPSIKAYYQSKNILTPGQLSAFEKIEARYSDAALALQQDWINSWDEKKKLAFKSIVDYYSRQGYYFHNIINKVRQNADYIPTEKEFHSIVENKYAQKYLKNMDVPAKFQVGDLVQIRGTMGWDANRMCIIIEDKGIGSWVKGGREYIVSFPEDMSQGKFRECDLKIAREKSLDKKKP